MPFRKIYFFNATQTTAISALLAIVIALLSLSGWLFDLEILKSFNHNWASMKVNTALGIIFSAVSLLLFASGKKKRLALMLAFIVFLLGTVSLFQYLFHWNAHIDELFFSDKGTPAGTYPGRMAKITAILFIIFGISLLIYPVKRKQLQWISEFSAILVLINSFIIFIAYLFSASLILKTEQLTSVSIPVIFSGLLLSVAMLFARPGNGLLAAFHKNTAAASVGLKSFLIIIITLVLSGWLYLKGEEAGLFDITMGLSFWIITYSLIIFFVIWLSTRSLNKAEVKLKESEEKYRSLIEQSSDAIVLADKNGKYVEVNESACRLSGYSKEEFINFHIGDLIGGDENFVPVQFKEMAPGNTVIQQSKLKKKDGSVIIAEISARQLPDGKLIGIIRDITERFEAEQKLNKEKYLSEKIINSLPGLFYLSDPTPKLLRWNNEFEKVSGYTAGELGKIIPLTLFDAADQPEVKQSIEKIYQKGFANIEVPFLTKSGEKIPFYFTGVRIEYEGKPAILGTGINISEKVKAEEQIIKEKELSDKLINNLPGIFYHNDESGKFLRWNKNFENVTGYNSTEINQMNLVDFYDSDGRDLLEKRGSSVFENNLTGIELNLLTKDKTKVPYYINTFPIDFEGKKTLIGTGADLTERKIAEDRIKLSEDRYRLIVETSQEGIWMIDEKNCTSFVNNRMAEMLGYTTEEMVGKDLYDFMNEEGRIMALENVRRRKKGLKDQHDFPLRTKDGKIIWTLMETSPIFKEGEYKGALAMVIDITGRKKTEADRDRLLNVIQKSLNEIYLFDPDTLKFEYINKGAQINLGYSLQEMLTMTPLDIKPEFTLVKFRELLTQARNSKKGKIIFETVHKRKDKSLYPVEVHLQMITYFGQSVFLAVILDITERKIAEKEIKKSNERFELIARATNDALWDWNLETNQLWGNEMHQQLYGLTMDDPVPNDKEWRERIHPEDREQSVEGLKKALASGLRSYNEEYRFYTENKGWINVYGRTLIERDKDGNPVRLVGSMMDMTETKNAIKRLTESEEKFRTLVQQAGDGIFIVDQDGNYLDANQSAALLTGYLIDELKKMNAADIIDPEDLKRTPLKLEEIKKGFPVFAERVIRKKDGHSADVEINSKLMDNGKVIAILRDITQRKKAEQELDASYKAIRTLTRHLQNIQEKERANMAREIHDELGQQLTVLKMDISWINKKMETTASAAVKQKMKELMEMLDGTVKTVRRISSSLRPSLLDDLGLVAAMEWQVAEFEKRSGIKIFFTEPAEEAILPDEIKISLFRILQESLTNVARHSDSTKVNVSLLQRNNSFVLQISDNGKGFDKQKIAGTKTLGILGMKERTTMLGGTYEITSTPGKGTSVLVTVPLGNKI